MLPLHRIKRTHHSLRTSDQIFLSISYIEKCSFRKKVKVSIGQFYFEVNFFLSKRKRPDSKAFEVWLGQTNFEVDFFIKQANRTLSDSCQLNDTVNFFMSKNLLYRDFQLIELLIALRNSKIQ